MKLPLYIRGVKDAKCQIKCVNLQHGNRELYIQKGKERFSNTDYFRVGVWRFSYGYRYFTGVVITRNSSAFISNQQDGYGEPQDAVEIPYKEYSYVLALLRRNHKSLLNYFSEMPEHVAKDEAVIAKSTYSWCMCNNAKDLSTEDPEDGVGYDDKNWVGDLDGLNYYTKDNSNLDIFNEVLRNGKVKYVSHIIFELLDKAITYNHILVWNYIKSQFENRVK